VQAVSTAMQHSMVPASDSGMLPSRHGVVCSMLGSMPGCRLNNNIYTKVPALCHAATVLALTPAAHCTHPIHQHQDPAAACAPSTLERAKYKCSCNNDLSTTALLACCFRGSVREAKVGCGRRCPLQLTSQRGHTSRMDNWNDMNEVTNDRDSSAQTGFGAFVRDGIMSASLLWRLQVGPLTSVGHFP
jgi:hypothetical protein